MNLKFRLLVK